MMPHWICGLIVVVALQVGGAHAQDYVYSDGSANVYRITPRELRYVPTKKSDSSSGVYSGGEEKSVALSDADYQSLVRLLDAAMTDKARHTDQRVMMSGAIRRDAGDARAHVILRPDASIKREIEAALAAMLQRDKPP